MDRRRVLKSLWSVAAGTSLFSVAAKDSTSLADDSFQSARGAADRSQTVTPSSGGIDDTPLERVLTQCQRQCLATTTSIKDRSPAAVANADLLRQAAEICGAAVWLSRSTQHVSPALLQGCADACHRAAGIFSSISSAATFGRTKELLTQAAEACLNHLNQSARQAAS